MSRRRRQQDPTLFYDLARRGVVPMGKDWDDATLQRLFAWVDWRRTRPL